jgi:hypothetical protein
MDSYRHKFRVMRYASEFYCACLNFSIHDECRLFIVPVLPGAAWECRAAIFFDVLNEFLK